MSISGADEDQQSRRRRLLILFSIVGVVLLITGLALASALSAGGQGSTGASTKPEDAPRIEAGELTELEPTSSDRDPAPLDGADRPLEPELWPITIVDEDSSTWTPRPGERPAPRPSVVPRPHTTEPVPSASPTHAPEPSASPSPKPTGSPGPDPQPTPDPTGEPSPEPTPEPTPGPTSEPTPEPTSTPSPDPTAEPSPEPTPGPTTNPTPEPTKDPDPTPEPTQGPAVGGEDEKDAQRLPLAIKDNGYDLLMHVTGDFDLVGAEWSVAGGQLPEGLGIDPNNGQIRGIVTAEVGTYVFRMTVTGRAATVSGWFFIEVIPSSTPDPDPTPGPEPTPTPTSDPSPSPTPEPTVTPTPGPTPEPTETPGPQPTPEPTDTPDPQPTPEPTPEPTGTPSPQPTAEPTPEPTQTPDPQPTPTPSPEPTETAEPTPGPTPDPSPTVVPTPAPTDPPVIDPGGGGAESDVLTFNPPTTVNATIGEHIDVAVAATSSLGLEIAYSATGLPSWMSLVDGKLLGAAPTATGSFNITLTASNAKNIVTRQVTVAVHPQEIEYGSPSLTLSPGVAGQLQLEAHNGASNASFVFTLLSGAPGEVTLDAATLTATYPSPGTFVIRVSVRDVNAPSTNQAVIEIPVEVTAPPIEFEAGIVEVTQYMPFEAKLSATGGWGQFSFKVASGQLPPQVKLSFDGTLTGVVGTVGEHTVVIQTRDLKGVLAEDELVIRVSPNPAITPTASITVGSSPQDMALSADGSRLFVISNKRLDAIDTTTHEVVATAAIPLGAIAIASSSDGRFIAVGIDGFVDTVSVRDAVTLSEVISIQVREMRDVLWAKDSAALYVMRSASPDAFDIIDVNSWTTTTTIALPTRNSSSWQMVALPDGKVVATTATAAVSYLIDPESLKSAPLPADSGGQHVTPAEDGTLWVAKSTLRAHIDVATGQTLAKFNLGSGMSSNDMALSPDGRWLYELSGGTIAVVDTEKQVVIARVPVPAAASGEIVVSPDGRKVFVAAGVGRSEVIVLEPAS